MENHLTYLDRHLGSRASERADMLRDIGVDSMQELIDQTIPRDIRLTKPLALPPPISEHEYLKYIRTLGAKNKLYKSYIGLGFYDTITPSVILRTVFENPGWYTQYTPYQSEISQGRLEALLNFQTMVMDLTGMELANASLLDEATSAAEAMSMLHRLRSRDKIAADANSFFVSDGVFQHTIDVLRSRAEPLGIRLVIGDVKKMAFAEPVFGMLLQFPDKNGLVFEYVDVIAKAHTQGCLVAVAADLLSLAILRPPGECGADVVVGSTQRFGVPLGYGGPHAAYFATRDEFKRQVPGRIIGVSQDRHGHVGYRMALQTREQHIRREKATSNICTAQALPAIMAGLYGVYHGPDGIRHIAETIHSRARLLEEQLRALGVEQLNEAYFDTLLLRIPKATKAKVEQLAGEHLINFRSAGSEIGISLDETTSMQDLREIFQVFATAFASDTPFSETAQESLKVPPALVRTSAYLQHPAFNSCRSETQMMRYIKSLEEKDLSLTKSMIPLGSCTMKLNPATAMRPVSWPEFSIHPFVPVEQAAGYRQMIQELEKYLAEITGFAATSLQPNSGAQGEFTGLMVIRAYHQAIGQGHRNIVLIPTSAHGTNPASAVMAGSTVVLVQCNERGDIDLADLERKALQHADHLAALMVTYPSTHGVYEKEIIRVCEIIHKHGGQVYMDGANMNAQVGLTSPAKIGADVCHLNLHKTFAIPHGGGGPGVGPVCAANHLAPFLPGHSIIQTGGEKAISAVSATPWGSASVLLISYAYIKMLGAEGVTEASQNAILNANYLKARLEGYFPILYTGDHGRVAHEMIIDLRHLKKYGIEAEDVAKRLMDYGFHAPTVSFPVPGTMMMEPTESEPKEELDRFCSAMTEIYNEIQEIDDGRADKVDNVLKNAPHTAAEGLADLWTHAYSRQKAFFPLAEVKLHKFWPPVARIDNTYGDRNLFCSCPAPGLPE